MSAEGMSAFGIIYLASIRTGILYIRLKDITLPSVSFSGPQEVSTRVMIFSSFRESVQEIAAMLNRHAPLIRVMTFMGQASAGKGVKGFTQKEQLEVKPLLIKGRIMMYMKSLTTYYYITRICSDAAVTSRCFTQF